VRDLVLRLGDIVGFLGLGVFVLSALLMIYLWISTMMSWLEWPGLVLGIITCPGAVIFPFVYWLVEGEFPSLYFALWAPGVTGVTIGLGWRLLRPTPRRPSREPV
jgi:hypothetical protein